MGMLVVKVLYPCLFTSILPLIVLLLAVNFLFMTNKMFDAATAR